jgi:outer membrane protein assembly factor BamB
MFLRATGIAVVLICTTSALLADDWPQWMGPTRDGVWQETGIVEKFPEEGLRVKWRVPIHGGYAGPAVAGGRVFVTDYVRTDGDASNDPGTKNELDGTERVLCLDAATGNELWKHEYDCPYKISYACGPRTTPAVDGDRVYTLGAEGNLYCFETATGKVVWSKELKREYRCSAPHWGFAGHPLVDGDKLICLVGGEGSVVVAFDKRSGKELWKALSVTEEAGYCPPSIIEAGGTRQLIVWTPDAVNSLDPESGTVYWSVPLKPQYGMSIMMPRKSGDYLFASGIGEVGALMKLAADKPGASIAWQGTPKNAVYCANSTPLIVDGTLYGVDCKGGQLRAVELQTGRRLWETFAPTTGERRGGHGTAFLVRNGKKFFLFSETGDLVLARLTPQKYAEISRFHVLEPTGECFGRPVVWSHPAFAEQSMFARNDAEIVCVSLAK